MTPRRLTRERTKGWRMPKGAVYVGRPTRWGNPWAVGDEVTRSLSGEMIGGAAGWYEPDDVRSYDTACIGWLSDDEAVALYRDDLMMTLEDEDRGPQLLEDLETLRGRDLVCWCLPQAPCHADVLIAFANR